MLLVGYYSDYEIKESELDGEWSWMKGVHKFFVYESLKVEATGTHERR